jgi:hypothetical protein
MFLAFNNPDDSDKAITSPPTPLLEERGEALTSTTILFYFIDLFSEL